MKQRKEPMVIPMIALIILAIIYLFPLLIMFLTSFKTVEETFGNTARMLPSSLYIGNYVSVFEKIPFVRYFLNTMWVSLMNVLGTIICTPMIAYSLAKVRWKGRNIIFSIVTATMIIPYTVTMIPLYKMWSRVHLIGSFFPLIVPAFFGAPLFIILLRQFMLSIPDSLLDASRIDGCNAFQRFVFVAIPLCKPGIATITIFSFMYSFSDFLGPLLYLNKTDHYTLSLGLQSFLNEHTTDWNSLMAAATLFMIPVLILFLICQKQFIEGIATSGLKG